MLFDRCMVEPADGLVGWPKRRTTWYVFGPRAAQHKCRRRRATLPTKPTPIEGGMAWVVVVFVRFF